LYPPDFLTRLTLLSDGRLNDDGGVGVVVRWRVRVVCQWRSEEVIRHGAGISSRSRQSGSARTSDDDTCRRQLWSRNTDWSVYSLYL